MKCKISNWICIYHACMTDECQKKQVLNNNINWGKGNCETTKHEKNRKSVRKDLQR